MTNVLNTDYTNITLLSFFFLKILFQSSQARFVFAYMKGQRICLL